MDKQQETELRSELKSLFQSKYDSEKWQQMLIDFFGATEIRAIHRELTSEHNDKVKGWELGTLSLPGFKIGLYEFEIKKSYRIAFNRVGLRSLVKSYTNYKVDAALVVYYSGNQWRLSYVCDLSDEKTAPKRFTYLFGNSDETYRTAIDRFLFLKDNGVTVNNIKDAFSVDKLTTDFFNGYKAQFKKFCTHIGGEEKWQRDYVKKLLGRLVFLQFLQKKGWMGVPLKSKSWKGGDPNYIRTLIDRHRDNDRLLSEVLEPLFFETLNQQRPNDGVVPVLGDEIRIPYLNGGLFDRDELDRKEIDFPFAFFDDLIEFFSHYNFTIDENDPDDSDMGIDPEMLGHIFENLLEDNKDKGTFYTPKEIVQYMSRESLIQYLCSHTDASLHPAIELLIQVGEVEPALQDSKVAEQIDDLLRKVKVCDPAIGSGAFPMGVLSEIFKCRRMLYGFMKNALNFSPSQIKREIIQQNIYGVDIEQGAVDIARLRFWLSLVVDEDQPQPLPNLDYKIMQGNSLLESFEGIDLSKFAEEQQANGELFGSSFEAQTREAIGPLIKQHFSVTDHREKEQIRSEIDAIIRQHIEDSLDRREKELEGKRDYHAQRVKSNQEFIDSSTTTIGNRRKYEKNLKLETYQLNQVEDQLRKVADSREHIAQVDHTNRPFFLWHLYFKDVFDRGGFDIVIANPPYVQVGKGIYPAEKYPYSEGKDTGKQNLYKLFVEAATNICKDKGISCLIVQSSLLCDLSSKYTRELLLDKTKIIQIIEFPKVASNRDGQVFESVLQGTCMYCISKEVPRNNSFKISVGNDSKTIGSLPFEAVIQAKIKSYYPEDFAIPLLKKGFFRVLEIVNAKSVKFDSIIESINQGDVNLTGVKDDITTETTPIKLLRGRNISKYRIEYDADEFISSGKFSRLIQKNCTNQYLVCQEVTGTVDKYRLHFAITDASESFLFGHTANKIKLKSGVEIKYILGILNSNLLDKIFRITSTNNHVGGYEIRQLPIVLADNNTQNLMLALVDQILEAKRENPAADTSALEAEIDRMVYDLYGLTEAEINIVEGRQPEPEQIPEKKMKEYDFFISHASEDKKEFVRHLAKNLSKAGCRVWYDEFELKLGDSLRKKIDHGLANSRYGIVVISRNFMTKNWPEYELNGMMAREIDGVKVILPLWHGVSKAEVMAFSPMLADKLALDTSKCDMAEIICHLKKLL